MSDWDRYSLLIDPLLIDLLIFGGTCSMAKCEICGKAPQFGHNVSHSMRHTKRQFKVNIQKATVTRGGKVRKMKVCTRCLRTLSKA
jgi:large subunit ribosomal protein L28